MQRRIKGVALNVAWPYLTPTQKSSFKKEAREIVHKLRTLKGPHQYVVPDPNPQVNKGLTADEVSRLLGHNPPKESYFAHNDLQPSNIIVHNDRIVGVIDWEMAGFFGERAADVHRNLRTPSFESLSQTNIDDAQKADLIFWNDIYDEA
jgi:Ser/Thr protein kinase RdoA (MazF antagonist)